MPQSLNPAVEAITSNPLKTRSDMIHLLDSLLQPLISAQSSSGARIELGHTGTHFDVVAAEMEGYARSLWGLAPILASEPENELFKAVGKRWVQGLEAGTNPANEEYWGETTDLDQRFVEMAAIVGLLSGRPCVRALVGQLLIFFGVVVKGFLTCCCT